MSEPWGSPPILKIYEALGALADGRLQEKYGHMATIISSDRSQTYRVAWEPATNELSSNDNASYWRGYLGYPGIAYMMHRGELPFDPEMAEWFRGIEWRKLNRKLKHHEKVAEYLAETHGIDMTRAEGFAMQVLAEFEKKGFLMPDKRPSPPPR